MTVEEMRQLQLFPCHMCGKTFTSPRNAKRHVNHIHLGQKRFSCAICTRPFARKEDLKKHFAKLHKTFPWDESAYVYNETQENS